MAVYRVKIPGMKPVLVRDKSRPKALDQLVTMDALTGEEMADALAAGETIWKAGDKVVPEPASEQITRINFQSGMWEAPGGTASRPATIDEMNTESAGDLFRVDPKSGMVQRQPAGADSDHWEDIRAASGAEIADAKKR